MMLYILLPVFNEEAHIRKLLDNIDTALPGREHKIIIVDDGSTDRTVEIARESGRDHVTVLSHNINLSIGAVYSTGINHIRQEAEDGDVLVLMESDLTSPAGMIHVLADEITERGRDLVIASRYRGQGGYANFPLTRTLFSYGANYFMRFFFPIPGVRDYTIFLRAYRVGLLKKVFTFFGPANTLQTRGFVSNAELLVKCSLFTDNISEVAFTYNYGLKENPSKLRALKTMLEYFSFVFYMKEVARKFQSRKKSG